MKTVSHKGTDDTPFINLDSEKGIFRISGISRPENVVSTYSKILNWIDDNKNDLGTLDLNCEFGFIYINTSSQKMIYQVLCRLEEIHIQNNNIIISWEYQEEDDDMLEIGQEFEELLELPFKFSAK